MPISLTDTPLGGMLRKQERQAMLEALVRRRFGDDPRIPATAERLASEDAGPAVEVAMSAATLDGLAVSS